MKNMITTYRDLPIGKWAEIQRIAESNPDELDLQVAVIGILSDMTEDEVLALPLAEYHECVVAASFLTKADGAVAPRAAKRYICQPFVLIPSADYRKITTAQFIDWQEASKQGDAGVVEALSCLLVPEGCKYLQGYDVAEVQQAIATQMSTYDAMGLLAFFLTSLIRLLPHFLSSLETEVAKMPEGKTKTKLMGETAEIRRNLFRTDGDG